MLRYKILDADETVWIATVALSSCCPSTASVLYFIYLTYPLILIIIVRGFWRISGNRASFRRAFLSTFNVGAHWRKVWSNSPRNAFSESKWRAYVLGSDWKVYILPFLPPFSHSCLLKTSIDWPFYDDLSFVAVVIDCTCLYFFVLSFSHLLFLFHSVTSGSTGICFQCFLLVELYLKSFSNSC